MEGGGPLTSLPQGCGRNTTQRMLPLAGWLQVPLFPSQERKLVPVTVWAWTGLGADEGDAAAEWFSAYLGTPARLVRYAGKPTAAAAEPPRWPPPGVGGG